MKRIIYLLSVFLLVWTSSFARKTVKLNQKFDISDFEIVESSTGKTQIIPKIFPVGLLDYKTPMLPQIEIRYALDNNLKIEDIKAIVKDKILIASDVILDAVPYSAITDSLSSYGNCNDNSILAIDFKGIYPENPIHLIEQTDWDGINVANFYISPFEYDASNKKLYFNSSIDMEFELTDDRQNNPTRQKKGFSKNIVDAVKPFVINPEDVENIIASCESDNEFSEPSVSSKDKIDYIIITSSSLKNSFLPLKQWRQRLGLKSKIVTIDEIYASSTQNTPQLKIKEYIWNLYKNNGLVYVLLGGDDTVVPVQYCHGNVKYLSSASEEKTLEGEIPADSFYASTEGDLDWDSNKNGLIGEAEDKVSFGTTVIVGRIPVRTATDVSSVISKIIGYEQEPYRSGRMLFAGNKMAHNPNDPVQNDAELQSKGLYNSHIKMYWDGTPFYFTDSYTSFPGDNDYDVSAENLQHLLADGYEYVSMLTHGDKDGWVMESGRNYSSHDAKSLHNIGYSIITTGACNTNAFDCSENTFQDGCLSEAFIRNFNSGVTAYFGCSREALGTIGYAYLAGSTQQSILPIFNIINWKFNITTWGKACSQAKTYGSFIGSTGEYHWNRLGFNCIGDPAMTVHYKNLNSFNSKIIEISNRGLFINTKNSMADVCVTSTFDYGESFLKLNKADLFIDSKEIPTYGTIAVSSINYVPMIRNFIYLNNETFTGENNLNSNLVFLGSKNSSEGVLVKQGRVDVKCDELILESGFTVEKGAEFNCSVL